MNETDKILSGLILLGIITQIVNLWLNNKIGKILSDTDKTIERINTRLTEVQCDLIKHETKNKKIKKNIYKKSFHHSCTGKNRNSLPVKKHANAVVSRRKIRHGVKA